ncbi:uncharacterized protein LOC122853373 [Aphidius gifuensis]|uniref:uncharacterized protein LOC122853373 n=1 Tax=Aphidius gifuensis TaxID=684658 RepID=UPI001CDC3564|nr:uncharacterized protein LOC122853373 [Aphidius gifuensis]
MEIDMETDTSQPVEKLEKQTLNVKENVTSLPSRIINLDDVITKKMIEDAEKVSNDWLMNFVRGGKDLKVPLHRELMIEMHSLFYKRPQLKKICKNMDSELVVSCFTKYNFQASHAYVPPKYNHLKDFGDLKYIIQSFGYNLTCLDVTQFTFSQIMPLINTNCPSLKQLDVAFKEIKDKHFENVFSNMHKLEDLSVMWQCEKSTLPMTLVKSLEQIGGTLKRLHFSRYMNEATFLPDSLALVLPRLIALEDLNIYNFHLSAPLVQSIGETNNLKFLVFIPPTKCPIINEKIDMYPIGNLKNLETLYIPWDRDGTDEFLINLCNNSKKLRSIGIIGTNITDDGMIALNNLSQLTGFDFGLAKLKKTNNFITDKSIECLFNEKLETLNLLNFTKISNRSVIKAFENLPNLSCLCVENTNVTIEVVEELSKLTKFHKEKLRVYVSFEDCNGIFKSLMESHNVEFVSTSKG